MSRFFALAHHFPARSKRVNLLPSLTLAALLFLTTTAHAQFNTPPQGTQVHDTTALHPPVGSRVAIVEFEDLECPACAHANPVIKNAIAQYKIPWVRHDFLIPNHIWSREAAINARWFDTHSKALGDEYRDQVFANQTIIYNTNVLHQFTAKFAADHHITMPFSIDPQGKLIADVLADGNLGARIGITHTPTIWVVTDHSKGAPFIEVQDTDQLFQIIDQALADTAAPVASAKKKTVPAKKTASN